LLGKKREIKINKITPHNPATCYEIQAPRNLWNLASDEYIEFWFNQTTIYSISWETNLKNWTDSKREWPFHIYHWLRHDKGSPYLVEGNVNRHYQIQDKNMVEVTLQNRFDDVYGLALAPQIGNNVICNVQVIAIKTDEQLIDSDKTNNLPISIGVPATNEEEQYGVSREDPPKTTDAPMDDSDEADNLPVIIGVSVAILLVVVVISAILYKEKLCSKMLL
jgi:hypothetical protein